MKRKNTDPARTGIVQSIAESEASPPLSRWSPATRIAFRFGFIYFGLFCLATQISGSLFLFPGVSFRGFGPLWPMQSITAWTAAHVFNIDEPLAFSRNSGETIFFWVQTFWLLTLATLATIAWSVLDRGREHYRILYKWFRLFVRFSLAASLFEYGMTKIIPIQFPRPSLTTLVTPAGNLSLSALLWASIGASPAYERFTGGVEILGGILLLVPRTTVLGAMICLAAMTHVFVLNMTYDIGLKQVSFHLILLAAVLLLPELQRLADFFLRDRATAASSQPPLFRSARANRAALAVQVLLGIYLAGMQTYANWRYWYTGGGGSPRSALYGIWSVDQLSIDGQQRPPVLNDYDRQWRRVIFDSPESVAFQRLDDSFAHYGVSIDPYNHTLALTKGNSRKWRAALVFQRPAADKLTLDGEMDGHRIHLQLQLVDFDTLRVLNSGFRWVRPDEP